MSNDDGLVDEFEKLQKLKAEIEVKEQEIRTKLITLAKDKNTEVLFWNNKKCFIKEYEKVIFPENKEQIVKLIKEKGVYDKFSSVNYLKLSPAIINGEIDKEIANLTKKEKAFRLSLKDI